MRNWGFDTIILIGSGIKALGLMSLYLQKKQIEKTSNMLISLIIFISFLGRYISTSLDNFHLVYQAIHH